MLEGFEYFIYISSSLSLSTLDLSISLLKITYLFIYPSFYHLSFIYLHQSTSLSTLYLPSHLLTFHLSLGEIFSSEEQACIQGAGV